ncbi:MAG: DUF134 domain-containing protein [Candidatus Bipolaricaulia bacterium]
MPRRRKQRRCAFQPEIIWFFPGPGLRGNPLQPAVELGLDELEAMRLVDLLGRDQTAAGEEMGISRGTVQRLLYSGRSKVVQALLEGRPIRLSGGRKPLLRCAACGFELPAPSPGSDGFLRCCRCGSPHLYRVGQPTAEAKEEEVS